MATAVSTPRANLFQFICVSTPVLFYFENGCDCTLLFQIGANFERKH
jgi:hypothetical protein